MKTLMLVIALAAGSILSADVVTSVNCTVGGLMNSPGSTVTNSQSCSLQSVVQQPFGSAATASAAVNASFSLADNPNSYSSVSITQNASAGPGMDNNAHIIVANAGSQALVNETLFTAGYVRPGFVQIIASASSQFVLRYSGATQILSLGNIYVDCTDELFFADACTFFPNGDHNLGGSSQLPSGEEYPFTLGQAFNLNYLGSTGASAYFSDAGSVTDSSIQFQFRFFEADGATPVAVEATPEPNTFALFGVALGALVISKRRYQR